MRLDAEEMEKRRNTIIEVAYQQFCENGADGVSMRQLAKLSDVGTRTIYRYFDTKLKLVIDALVHQWDKLMVEVRKNIGFHTTYPALTGYEQATRWLDAFGELNERIQPLILFSAFGARHTVVRLRTWLAPVCRRRGTS